LIGKFHHYSGAFGRFEVAATISLWFQRACDFLFSDSTPRQDESKVI